jgi:gas vesicle protein
MGANTEELRREIEHTRGDLGNTLDAIGDRISPSRVMERRRNRVSGAFRNMRERVMGAGADAGHAIGTTADDAMQSMHDAPQAIRAQAQGSPMAAGAIAFGIGFITAAAFPPSRGEQQMAGQLSDRIEPLKSEVTTAAHDLVDQLKEPAKDAVDAVKGTAAEAAHSVQGAAKDAAAQTKEDGQQALTPR